MENQPTVLGDLLRSSATGAATLQPLWKLLDRFVLVAGLIVVSFVFYYVYSMSHAHPVQSDGWQPISVSSGFETLSQSLPPSATRICFARSSVGLGGRFMAYAVDGTLEDLDSFALSEFAAHGTNTGVGVEPNTESPFDLQYVEFLERGFAVDLEWLKSTVNVTGTTYRDRNGQVSHMPTIFVDRTNGVLYFVMTD